jgi:GNAT superfamily N-acetyltransferase
MSALSIRPLRREDQPGWRPLWDGYNAFYGRSGETALPESITGQTWERFFDPAEAMHALVAEHEGQVVGLVHYLFHRSTTRMHDVCYLQDLFTLQSMRGKGVGRHLIEAVYEAARQKGSNRVYWHTFDTNLPGRALYDKMTTYTGAIMYGYDIK